MPSTFYALLAVTLYCAVQSIRDVRRKQYGWAVLGAAAVVALLTMPFPTHAVKIDLPVPTAR